MVVTTDGVARTPFRFSLSSTSTEQRHAFQAKKKKKKKEKQNQWNRGKTNFGEQRALEIIILILEASGTGQYFSTEQGNVYPCERPS